MNQQVVELGGGGKWEAVSHPNAFWKRCGGTGKAAAMFLGLPGSPRGREQIPLHRA